MPGPKTSYAPLDTAKPVADDVWIVDSGHRAFGMPLPVRMTIVRLHGGDLWLHSPTRFTPRLHDELQALGRIRHLVAPNSVHWSYLKAWQDRCADAATWAAPGLRKRPSVKASGVRIDHDLDDAPPPDWAGEIDQAVVRGGLGFREVVFFHRASRTLVLTDLVVNVRPEDLPFLARQGARLVGATAPEGRAPAYLRRVIGLNRREAAAAARRAVAWQPERVILSHGDWFDEDASGRLRRALAWLTG